ISNKNGWYQVLKKRIDSRDVYCYYRFYKVFPQTNEYFKSQFADDIHLDDVSVPDTIVNQLLTQTEYNITSEIPLIDQIEFTAHRTSNIVNVIYLFAILLIILFSILNAYNGVHLDVRKLIVMLCFSLSILSFLTFFGVIFSHLSHSALFKPELAAFS